MSFTFSAKVITNESSSLMWQFFVPVPNEYLEALSVNEKRVICTINDSNPYHAALMPDGLGGAYVLINKERRKKLGIEADSEIKVKLEVDESEYGMEVPEVFLELCDQDPEGSTVFHQLTRGKQRTLLNLMNKPKSEQKKLEKVLVIFDYLKSVNGKLDFKELNEAFKNNRFKL